MLSERLLKDRVHPRFTMVNCQLRPQGVGDARLIEAFGAVPREAFVPLPIQPLAYADADLPLTQGPGSQRWLLAPLTLGKLLQLANIQPDDKVLVVGCGSGYSLALVAQLAAHVIGVESHEDLAESARSYGVGNEIPNSQVVIGALSVGYPKKAPYDVILIEGAVAKIPPLLMQQLSPHQGRLVTIVREEAGVGQVEFGKGMLITRIDGALSQVAPFDANCPYLPEFEPRKKFHL